MTSSPTLSSPREFEAGAGVIAIALPDPERAKEEGSHQNGVPRGALIVGPENGLVFHLIQQLSQPDRSAVLDKYSPVVLYGPSGLGKTHVLHALAAHWRTEHPQETARLINASELAAEYADAVNMNDTTAFQRRYQRSGLLLLDNLDHLTSKPLAQEQLILILDHRKRTKRLTIVAARQYPQRLDLVPRLRSRLAEGLSLPLYPPDRPARRQILQALAGQRRLPVTDAALDVLAERVTGPVPQLQAAVARLQVAGRQQNLVRQAVGQPSRIDTDLVQQQLGREHPSIDPKRIIRLTARQYGLKVGDLVGSSRRKLHVTARSTAMYLMRQLLQASYQEIGQHFGRRDHTTVLHACRKIAAASHSDAAIRQNIADLTYRLMPLATLPSPGPSSDG